MYCKECNVNIEGYNTKCPLCGQPIEVQDGATLAFPRPNPRKKVKSHFIIIYAAFTLAVMIPCLAINLRLDKSVMWSLMIFAALIYVFFFIRYTVMAQAHFRQRLIGQTIILTAVSFVFYYYVKSSDLIFVVWFPTLYISSYLSLMGHMLRFPKYATKNILAVYLLAILGLIPTFAVLYHGVGVKEPAFLSSAIGAALALCVTVIFRKAIISEIKKFFHL